MIRQKVYRRDVYRTTNRLTGRFLRRLGFGASSEPDGSGKDLLGGRPGRASGYRDEPRAGVARLGHRAHGPTVRPGECPQVVGTRGGGPSATDCTTSAACSSSPGNPDAELRSSGRTPGVGVGNGVVSSHQALKAQSRTVQEMRGKCKRSQ